MKCFPLIPTLVERVILGNYNEEPMVKLGGA